LEIVHFFEEEEEEELYFYMLELQSFDKMAGGTQMEKVIDLTYSYSVSCNCYSIVK
jgi:hypothetical protein